MSYVWEEDIDIFAKDPMSMRPSWHLKKVIPQEPGEKPPWRLGTGPMKVSVAWVTREGERKFSVRFVLSGSDDYDKTFRSLKAAKAYALAIVSLTT
jgi:hypothetical protein